MSQATTSKKIINSPVSYRKPTSTIRYKYIPRCPRCRKTDCICGYICQYCSETENDCNCVDRCRECRQLYPYCDCPDYLEYLEEKYGNVDVDL